MKHHVQGYEMPYADVDVFFLFLQKQKIAYRSHLRTEVEYPMEGTRQPVC